MAFYIDLTSPRQKNVHKNRKYAKMCRKPAHSLQKPAYMCADEHFFCFFFLLVNFFLKKMCKLAHLCIHAHFL